jgi:hypothetical protein
VLNRKVTLTAPKLLDADTQITGGSIDYCYFTDGVMTPYMRGGSAYESIPLDGLQPADKKMAEDFMAMLVRLMGDEITLGTAKAEAARKNPVPMRFQA